MLSESSIFHSVLNKKTGPKNNKLMLASEIQTALSNSFERHQSANRSCKYIEFNNFYKRKILLN